MTADITPEAVAKMLDRMTFEAINGEIDNAFAGEIGKLLKSLSARVEALEARLATAYRVKYRENEEANFQCKRAEAAEAENARLRDGLHDAINRPKGVVPASADEFYDPRTAIKGESHE
jgi:hypothetical protein